MNSEFKAIGKPTPLIDGRAKVSGALRYTPDVSIPNMLHARLVMSPYAHARIQHIDRQSALNVPGVVAVLTAEDLPAIPPTERNRLLLARGRVIFSGQPVALVLATSEAAAADGLEQVVVDYESLAAAVTMEQAMADDAPLVWPDKSNIASRSALERGDVNTGFAEADVIVERTFTTPMVHQSPLETQSVVVQPDALTGGAAVWASTQAPFEGRQAVAEVLGVPLSDVRVMAMAVGGGFGSKEVLYEPLVALAARKMGHPVRLALTRMEDLAAASPAPAMRVHARLGAKQDGTLVSLQAEAWIDCGIFPSGWLAYHAPVILCYSYRIPNYRVQAMEVMTFKVSAGNYRAPCGPPTALAVETLVDEIARTLGMDPIELRLRNAVGAGDLSPANQPWADIGMRQVLAALQEHPAWQQREAARAAGRGVGIAIGGWPGSFQPAVAVCSLGPDGVVQVLVGSADISGTATGFRLLAAEAFGVEPENVRVTIGDTQSAPYAGMSVASKVTYTTGGAVVKAAHEARQQALAIASEEFEVAVEDLEIVDGKIQVRGYPSKSLRLVDVAAKTMDFGAKYAPVLAQGRHVQVASAPVFNAQLAEVEVDRETGKVRVCRLVTVQDVGRAINPLAIQGQMHGGATQGIGWALYEAMIYDEQGSLLSGSWMDYAIPSSEQTASLIETVIVEVPCDDGPFGARGVGEAPVVSTAAAIANAIADATGARLTRLPMTPPEVLKAIQRLENV